jgi:trigger factor
MQITETLNDGLKRSYAVVVAAADLARKLDEEVTKVAPQVKMPGFRPGKVPMNLVKKMHGPALEGQVLESSIQDVTQKIFADHGLRPATQPKIDLKSYGKDQDLEFSVDLEILPEVPPVTLDGIALEKLVSPLEEADVDAAVRRLADGQKNWQDAAEGHEAVLGNAVVMDFLGKLDGEPFEGGKGDDTQLELGSGRFIPGFEEQLAGVKVGDAKVVSLTFPDDYHAENLKGKAATFDVTIKQVKVAGEVELNDELAKGFGLESLDQLRGLLRDRVQQELDGLSRTYLKRKLLDALAAMSDFPVPQGMVEAEFEQIWKQLEQEVGNDEAEKAKLEAEKEEYRAIAVRRVRLGLLLSDIGQKNNIQITQAEMNRLIAQEASKYPGQQKEVVKYFQDTPMAAAQLRAPLYEEKVVDYILGTVTVTEKQVTRSEIEAAIQDEGDLKSEAAADATAEAAAKPKKPRARKAAAETSDETPSQTEVA